MRPTEPRPEPQALRVRALGDFTVWRGEVLVPDEAWSRRKVLALFTALLGAPGYRMHREQLIDSLWPESTPEAGANNLRVTLHRLRTALDVAGGSGSLVRTTGDVVALALVAVGEPAAGIESDWFDAAAFARAATSALAGQDLTACRAARSRYTGDYLPGILYDEAVDARREELRQQHLALLVHGARLSMDADDERETIGWLEATLAHECTHEEAARALMRLHARTGRRREALRVYEALTVALQTELGQHPDRRTQDLAAALREPRAARPERTVAVRPREPLPEGTITFLFTDIEDSTVLWDQQPAAMRAALLRHDALVIATLARYGGRQIKERGEGDSIFAVFTSPSAALAAVSSLQQALLGEPWPPQTSLRVRMGLHTGEADVRDGSYYGVTVNRTARIRSAGYGGQILVSRSTFDLLRDALPEGLELRPLGIFALKGLARPEELFQVVHPTLPDRFPSPLAPTAASADAPAPTNLPLALSALIGRAREQQEIVALLERHRLVTLTGPGGVGKTRLAVAVAEQLAPRPPDGVWLIELAALSGTTDIGAPLIGQVVAATLGIPEEAERPLLATLSHYLSARSLLLILDNCEHLIGACAVLAAALLRSCPGLRILATSQERLEVAGELGYPVPPLGVPAHATPTAATLLGSEAAALFAERARERRPSFVLTDQNAPAVAQICRRLDGIPLAIELAAARLGALPVEDIAARLDDRFRLLTGGPRSAQPRQKTLRATLDWSYELLAESERVLLRRLAVFAAGCTLEAAVVVCAGGGLEEWVIVDVISGLVGRSLVVLDGDRYRLLETVRLYGWERLEQAGEASILRERHLGWCLALAEQADRCLHGPEQGHWLSRLDQEYDNLRAALDWSTHEGMMSEEGAGLAAALSPYWELRGPRAEGRVWLEAAGASKAALGVRARALAGAGDLAARQGDLARAEWLHDASLTLRRAMGEPRGIAQSLFNMGRLRLLHLDSAGARAAFEESLALARDLGDPWGLFSITNALGQAARMQRDYGRARALHEDALTIARGIGAPQAIAITANNLAMVLADLGDRETARERYEEALALHRAADDRFNVAGTLANLAEIAVDGGEIQCARALYRESLDVFRDLDAKPYIAICLEGLAEVNVLNGDAARCAALLGAAERIRDVTGTSLGPDEQTRRDRTAARVRALLGADADVAWATGRALDLDRAISLAVAEHIS
jgi:predicted ATPase/class 3 adenylate cyclase